MLLGVSYASQGEIELHGTIGKAFGSAIVVKSTSTPVKRATKRLIAPTKQRVVIDTSGAQ